MIRRQLRSGLLLGDAGGQQWKPSSAARGSHCGGRGESDVVTTIGERVSKRQQRPEVALARNAAHQHAHGSIISAREEARGTYRLRETWRPIASCWRTSKPRSTRSARPKRASAKARRSSSTCASATSGTRASSLARCTSRAGSWSRASRGSSRTGAAELVVYCSGGSRSAFAAKALGDLGYENVVSLAGGFTDWKRNGFPIETPNALTPDQRRRYSRHLLIPEVGEAGQERLLASRVLLIGAGGLGSPASLYLAAAGVGTLGIVDADVVDDSNLQRQIIHATDRLGEPKVESAKRTIEALNPDVTVKTYEERLTSENVERILGDGWDVIVDGADNFPTRYLVNDASVWHEIPVVHGSIYRFEGQVTVFNPAKARATAASSPRRRRRSSRRAAPRAASSASCPGSSARCRRTRR